MSVSIAYNDNEAGEWDVRGEVDASMKRDKES